MFIAENASGDEAGAAFSERALRTRDGLSLYFRDYGPRFSQTAPVLCLAGLTRNSKDFHALASRLSARRRVLCLDARGRGRSDYDTKYSNYNLVTEVGDALHLITQEFSRPCVIVGTSRGGLNAMILNGVRPDLLSGVVLNDIGPELAAAGLTRIMSYLGVRPAALGSWDDAVAALKAANIGEFPELTDAQWAAWARRTYRDEGGRPEMDYDLRLRDAALEAAKTGVSGDFWPQFRALRDKPILALRGENSDLLTVETMAQMRRAKPDSNYVTVRGRGHVPFLDEPEAIAAIESFFEHIDAQR